MELESKFVTYNNDGEATVGDDQAEAEERFNENYSGPYRTVAIILTVPPVDEPTKVAVTVPEEKAGPVTAEPDDLSEDEDPAKSFGA